MPSNRNPVGLVNPGPGKLSTGVVPASALLFPGGGGSSAALLAHITDPVDAHMASAIGVNPVYLPTGEPLLQIAGGIIPGESVLDFIAAAKDLFPIPPPYVGFNAPNDGRPQWGNLQQVRTGGWTDGTDVVFSHYLVPTGSTTYTLGGLVYPGDRGALTLYYSTDGDFFNSATTTLIAALWLGAAVGTPAGIPTASFDISLRTGQQLNYTATNVGLDQISLTDRLPYLSDYLPYGNPYVNFPLDFFSYQLATYAVNPQAVAVGNSGSWLLVHWKESFVTALADIQSTNLTLLTLVEDNVFSAVPSGGDFNTGDVVEVNRRYVFRDTNSGTAPSGSSWLSSENGLPTLTYLSGVQFYTGAGLTWNVDLQVLGLQNNSYLTGSVANPNVATGFESLLDPIQINLGDFGASTVKVPYYDLRKNGVPPNYSPTNAPQLGDTIQYLNASLTPVFAGSASPVDGYGLLRAELTDAFNPVVTYDDTAKRYLFNSYPQTGGSTAATETFEAFTDEKYRYVSNYSGAVPTAPLIPAGPDDFNSTTTFVASGVDLQVVGHQLVYPHDNFSAATYRPVAQPDYAAVLAADPASHIRRYVRAFNTGIARNTGKLRIQGLAYTDWASTGLYTGNEATDHPGGAIVQVRVPGQTGWLDVGRPLGDPSLLGSDGHGCGVSVTGSGSDWTVTFNTTAYTGDNGTGDFPLFVRVSLIKNGVGQTLAVDDIEWLPPG